MMPTTTFEEVKPKERPRLAPSEMNTDPVRIRSPALIPPPDSQFLGVSPQGLVAVYSGTIPGDIDAQPAAKELLGTSPDTGGLSNADYIYKQLSALYGNAQLPSFASPSGINVESVVFVSGSSSQGGYGALHIATTQTDFDKIVVDSMNVKGTYSTGSGLDAGTTQINEPIPHLFPIYRGPGDLHGILNIDDPRLKRANPADLRKALTITNQNALALKTAVENRNPSKTPHRDPSVTSHLSIKNDLPEAYRLVHTNREILALLAAEAQARGSRQYLSTALFAAELVESFQKLTRKADPGKTDGEAVSRILAFKLAPEIAPVTGFNVDIIQQWWKNGHRDYVTKNTENDRFMDGNASGMMFLEFLTDYLGVPMDKILQNMPSTSGAPLAQTYEELLKGEYSNFAKVAGKDGTSAFQEMTSLLEKHAQTPEGTLNLPADGNPFPDMPGSKQGGLFAEQPSNPGTLAQDAQAALGLDTQLDQQLIALRSTLQQIQVDIKQPSSTAALSQADEITSIADSIASSRYKPNLPSSLLTSLAQKAAPYRAPQYDQPLQQEFWKHVYNETANSGPYTDRLEVITGTNQEPLAVQVSGTITGLNNKEKDGDCHIYLQADDPDFPVNEGAGESPLEMEVIYTHHPTQPDAQPAEQNYTNPFDTSQLGPGVRILAAGPLIFDRVHGQPSPDGKSVETGLEIHPIVGMTVLQPGEPVPAPAPPPETPMAQLSADLASALAQLGTLNQTIANMTALLQKMKGEAPPAQG